MKKAFVAILSLAALVACSQDVTVKRNDSAAIGFDNSFVENKTRAAADPSKTTATLEEFAVWGFRDTAKQLVLNNERVYKNGTEWTYDHLQYWMKDKDYFFGAVSPINPEIVKVDTQTMSKDGLGIISFTNTDGSVDLLYAEKTVYASEINPSDPDKVQLQFAHLLSRVKFSFAYNFPNELTTIAVKNIEITNSPAEGSIDVTVDRPYWSWNIPQNGSTLNVAFGDVEGGKEFAELNTYYESDDYRLLIPTDDTRGHNITFDVVVYQNHVESYTYHLATTLKDKAFVQGKSYNIVTTITPDELGMKPIQFTVVEVEGWEDGDVAAPVALASPAVEATVAQNVVTLKWNAIEGADHYTVQVDDDIAEVVKDTTYVFEGDYAVEYTFNVVAVPADEEKFATSEAAVVTATTKAAPVVGPTYTTVEEFLALTDVVPSDAKDDVIEAAPRYILKGTITSVTNTSYGNFYLNDGTGEVLIYGLLGPNGEEKYWAQSGAKVGDDITVKTIRTEFNNSPQGKNATFVGVDTPGTLAFWSFEATSASFTAAAAEKTIAVAIYNTTSEVNAVSDNAQFSAVYSAGVLTISAKENTTADAIEGNITVTCGDLSQVISVSQLGASSGDADAVEAKISFADKANRTEYSTSKQVWEQNGIVVTNNKGASTSNVGDYANPARFYKSSNVTIQAPGEIISISIDCKGLEAKYVTPWGTADNGIVTITLDGTSDTYTFNNLSAQARANSMTVTYLE